MKDFLYANRVICYTLGVLAFLVLFYFFFFNPPADFPVGAVVKIEQGSTLRSVSLELKQARIIRSRLAFEAFVILLGKEKGVVRADYYFESKLPVWSVAERIAKGEHYMAPIMVTIPEGFDILQIADTFVSKLTNFNKSEFLLDAAELEGYLFPDTYFFFKTDTETDVIKSMRANFEKKMLTVKPDVALSGKTEKEIIIMASLIEGEAKGESDQIFISRILWKRISIGMPLQLDVSPETYKTKGLPKRPINNPGITAIKAALYQYAEPSPYLFFIYDRNDNIHYGKNFSEHQANIRKYLK